MTGLGIRSLATFCALVFAVEITNSVAADDPITRIFDDWRQRRQTFATVQYKLEGERSWPKGAFNFDPDLPPDDPGPSQDNPEMPVSGPLSRDVLLDLQGNRFRIDYQDSRYDRNSRSVYKIHGLNAGDGETYYIRVFENLFPGLGGGKAKPHVDLQIQRGASELLPPSILGLDYNPLFFAQGVVPQQGVYIRPTALAPELDPSEFTYGGERMYEGRDCEVLKNANKEYWVDPRRRSAIVKFVANPEEKFVTEIEYRRTALGWLPKSWTTTMSRSSKPWLQERIVVEEVITDPVVNQDLFRLKAKPGMYVDEVEIVRRETTGDIESEHTFKRILPDGGFVELNESLHPVHPDGGHN